MKSIFKKILLGLVFFALSSALMNAASLIAKWDNGHKRYGDHKHAYVIATVQTMNGIPKKFTYYLTANTHKNQANIIK